MSAEEEEVVAVAEAPAEEAPAPAPAPEPKGPFDVDLSAAQIAELWRAPSPDDTIKILARCLSIDQDSQEELRTQIWLDFVFHLLDFCKEQELSATKAKTFLGVMTSLHAHAVGALLFPECGTSPSARARALSTTLLTSLTVSCPRTSHLSPRLSLRLSPHPNARSRSQCATRTADTIATVRVCSVIQSITG